MRPKARFLGTARNRSLQLEFFVGTTSRISTRKDCGVIPMRFLRITALSEVRDSNGCADRLSPEPQETRPRSVCSHNLRRVSHRVFHSYFTVRFGTLELLFSFLSRLLSTPFSCGAGIPNRVTMLRSRVEFIAAEMSRSDC